MDAFHLARLFCSLGAYLERPENGPPFRLASGKESDYYIDCRRVLLNSEGARLLGGAVVRVMEELFGPADSLSPLAFLATSGIGGQALLGPTLARADDRGLKLEGCVVRDVVKGHGVGGTVAGKLHFHRPCVLLDDVLTSGNSLLELAGSLMALELNPRLAVVLVDRQEGGTETLKKADIGVHSLLTVSHLKEAKKSFPT